VRTVAVPFTLSDYAKLPEGFPAQLLRGMLVKESPTFGHQIAAARIYRRVVAIVGERRAILAPVDVVIDDVNVYQPDVAVYREPVPSGRPLESRLVPQVVFEVVSATSRARDRGAKRRRYLAAGVEEVWLLDEEASSVERFTRAASVVAVGDARLASEVLPSFVVSAADVFASA
jgi:Uma2 family endonuclease